jgi:hypothetical protein
MRLRERGSAGDHCCHSWLPEIMLSEVGETLSAV